MCVYICNGDENRAAALYGTANRLHIIKFELPNGEIKLRSLCLGAIVKLLATNRILKLSYRKFTGARKQIFPDDNTSSSFVI